jgi:hypothetical protein
MQIIYLDFFLSFFSLIETGWNYLIFPKKDYVSILPASTMTPANSNWTFSFWSFTFSARILSTYLPCPTINAYKGVLEATIFISFYGTERNLLKNQLTLK